MTLEEAKKILGEMITDGGIRLRGYDAIDKSISYENGDLTAILHNHWTADELEAIAVYMRAKK